MPAPKSSTSAKAKTRAKVKTRVKATSRPKVKTATATASRAKAKTRPTAASRPKAQPPTESPVVVQVIKPQAGMSAAPTAFDPMAPTAAMAFTPEEEHQRLGRPRPADTRYPISLADFAAMEAAAGTLKLGKTAKKFASIVADQADTTELALRPMMAAPTGTAQFEPPATAPTSLGNFAGISDTGWFPPDCTLAVGPNHVLTAVNASFAIYSKTGAVAMGPRTLSSWFADAITDAKIFDPKAAYDQFTNRWYLLAVAMPSDATKKESYFLLSVSKTSDPTGGWWNYKFDAKVDGATATDNWADYPALGLDASSVYLTANMFKFGGNYQYAKVRVVPKAALLTGAAASFNDFTKLKNSDGSLAFTVQPCHTFGSPGGEFLINSWFAASTNKLTLWTLAGTPLTLTSKTVTTSTYGQPPAAEQQGLATPLNSGDTRMLNAVCQSGSVWCGLTTVHNWGEPVNRAAIHWFQIDPSAGTLVQEGVYGAKALHYIYPALSPDTNGNLTIVFARSGATEFPSIFFSGRLATDPVGQLQASALLKAGTGSSNKVDGSGRNRWGDYSGISRDPADPRAVWFYSMYGDVGNKWGTWVGAARY